MSDPIEDKAFQEFLHAFEGRRQKELQKAQYELRQIKRKKVLLLPIKELLQKFVDMSLEVSHTNAGTHNLPLSETTLFSFYEGASSPSWGPGVSLFFDHPAEIEIAIPNPSDIEELGAVVIRVVSAHKDKNFLEKKHLSVEAAKDVIARFLGQNAIAIKKMHLIQKQQAKDNK